MIHLFTGMPGNGKTLYAISFVMREQDKWNAANPTAPRTVYYNGIPDCMIPGWVEFQDPAKWHELPPGSMVVIDECQSTFRPRHVSKEAPECVTKLETHRHDGFDIFLITQHPGLIDTNVRKLVGLHFNTIRKWGAQASTIHEWQGVREQPASASAKAESVKHHFMFPKAVYGLYRSAEVHTVQRRIPAKIYFLVLVPLFLVGAWFFMHGFYDKAAHKQSNAAQGMVTSGTGQKEKSPEEKLRDWYVDQEPRVKDLPQTAPKYDKVMTPVAAPKPAACVDWPKKGCRCYTQQATRMETSEKTCKLIVERGYFDDTKADAQTLAMAGSAPLQGPARPVVAGQGVAPGQPADAAAAAPPGGLSLYQPREPEATPGYVQNTVPLGSPWRAK